MVANMLYLLTRPTIIIRLKTENYRSIAYISGGLDTPFPVNEWSCLAQY